MMNSALIDREFNKLSFNAKLLLKEMSRRGIQLKELDKTFIVKASFGPRHQLLYDINTSLTPYPAGLMIDDKYYSKKILQNFGYSVCNGRAFPAKLKDQALKFAEQIGYPVVVKPTVGSHGDHVYLDIQNSKELGQKIDKLIKAKTGNGHFLVETLVKGEEYRLFITRQGFFAAVHRLPPSVIGDGESSLKRLVKIENHRRMNPRNTCLCEIKLDQEALDFLGRKDQDLDFVPKADQRVFLRGNSNVSTGGNCYEVSDKVHASIKQLAKRVLDDLNLHFIGIDLLIDRIDTKLSDYVICELNPAPGLSLHMMPEQGKPQDVAGALVDSIFPETMT